MCPLEWYLYYMEHCTGTLFGGRHEDISTNQILALPVTDWHCQSMMTNRKVIHLLSNGFGVQTPGWMVRTLRVDATDLIYQLTRPTACKLAYAALHLTSIVNLWDVKSAQRFSQTNWSSRGNTSVGQQTNKLVKGMRPRPYKWKLVTRLRLIYTTSRFATPIRLFTIKLYNQKCKIGSGLCYFTEGRLAGELKYILLGTFTDYFAWLLCMSALAMARCYVPLFFKLTEPRGKRFRCYET